MAYVDRTRKDDFQEDTFNILSELIIMSVQALQDKNISVLHSTIDSIYLLVWSRLNKEQQVEFEEKLSNISDDLYNGDVRHDELEASQMFDQLRSLFKILTGLLEDELGIMFRMRSDLDKLVMGRKK